MVIRMKKSKLREGISLVLSFLMMFCATIITAFSCLMLTAFNKTYIPDQMNSAYHEATLNSLVATLKTLAAPSQLPEEVFDDLFTISMVTKDSENATSAVLGGISYSFDESDVRKLLEGRFQQYAQTAGLDMKATNLDSLIDLCVQTYEQQISVPFLKTFVPIRTTFEKAFTIVLLAVSAFLIVSIVLLFSIHPYKHRALRYTIGSLFASALMVIPVPLIILLQGAYKKMAIEPTQVKMLFVSMTRCAMLSLVIGGLLLAAIGVALLPVVRTMRQSLLRKGHAEG